MSETSPETPVKSLILWPALLALAVTALRLGGERLGWSERLFSRKPGVVVMAVAIFGGLDLHYAKPRPDFPPLGPLGVFFWTAVLPQFSVWIFLTVVGGLLFGTLLLALSGRSRSR